ncbi:MAG: hypothetical protein R6W99_07205 [Clostridia bacterium]
MNGDFTVLRQLASRRKELIGEIDNDSKIKLWTDINDLKPTRPPVQIYQVPWSEFHDSEDMDLRCSDEFLRSVEFTLRREIYEILNFPGDMVYLNRIECPVVLVDSGFMLDNEVDIIRSGQIDSQHFTPVLKDEDDIYRIKEATVEYDACTTEKRLELLNEIFGDICEVELTGLKGLWFTPWDYLISRTGVTEAMIDLIERPDFVNAYVSRYVDVSVKRLHRYAELGVWASNNNNTIVGSGGYGYNSDLKKPSVPNIGAALENMWGCGNAQMFSEVSPDMHWEFSLRHEMRWLLNFGLIYYGCCEQLHHKIDILSKIPGLRKISMSPWANLDIARERIAGRYVMSIKPTPTALAMQPFDENVVRAEINRLLDKTAGNPTEFILKDISTVKGEPWRLNIWDRVFRDEIDKRF